jgi:peptidoglycan/xylan/chitin deacetylase (PgdA/CDA1 family)
MNNKGVGTFEVLIIIVFAVLMFSLRIGPLLPIVAHSQSSYFLPNQQQEQQQLPEIQGNQDKVMITGNESVNSSRGSSSNKAIIINFDDSHTNEYIYAKPILDRYGFKATFFEICSIVSDSGWKLVADMKDDGMDIESHTMTHPSLNKLSQSQLYFEIGQSKQCFLDHGVNTTLFAYPYGHGSNNATVADAVAKYYYLARTNVLDNSPLTLLMCDACPLADNITVTFENKYSINSWVHQHIEGDFSYITHTCTPVPCHRYNNSQMFEKFVTYVNSQDDYNKDGIIRAIPIVVYHDIVIDRDVNDSKIPTDTTMNLFNAEMKYLHDNGFKVLTMSDLGYDENNKYLYIKSSR